MGRRFHAKQSIFLWDLGKRKVKTGLRHSREVSFQAVLIRLIFIKLLSSDPAFSAPTKCRGKSLVAPDVQMKPKHGEVK